MADRERRLPRGLAAKLGSGRALRRHIMVARAKASARPAGQKAVLGRETREEAAMNSLFEGLERWRPQILGILRIVAALLFIEHGTSKFFAWPGQGGFATLAPLFRMESRSWLARINRAMTGERRTPPRPTPPTKIKSIQTQKTIDWTPATWERECPIHAEAQTPGSPP